MYKVVTKEDTIRIPAEYMRKGQSLDQHIDRLSMDAFEGKFDAENRFVLVTNCLLYTSPSPRDQRGSRMPSSA